MLTLLKKITTKNQEFLAFLKELGEYIKQERIKKEIFSHTEFEDRTAGAVKRRQIWSMEAGEFLGLSVFSLFIIAKTLDKKLVIRFE